MNDQTREAIISLVHNSPRISYADLHEALGTKNDRDLENILIEAVYEGLITGQIDPKSKVLEVSDWHANVPGPAELCFIKDVLTDWMTDCSKILETTEEASRNANAEAQKVKEEEEQHEKKVERKREEVSSNHRGGFYHFDDARARTYKRAKGLQNQKRPH